MHLAANVQPSARLHFFATVHRFSLRRPDGRKNLEHVIDADSVHADLTDYWAQILRGRNHPMIFMILGLCSSWVGVGHRGTIEPAIRSPEPQLNGEAAASKLRN